MLPALDLHPEVVVHQRVPEVLLALHELLALHIERPVPRPIGYPSGGTGGLLPPGVGLLAGSLGISRSLLPTRGARAIARARLLSCGCLGSRRHSPCVPGQATPDRRSSSR